MAQLARSVATLRIAGDDLIPEEISSLLGSEPTFAQRKGEEIPTKSGVRIAMFGHWRLKAKDAEPEDLDGQITELLSKLTQDVQIWQLLGKRFRIDLFCGWFMNESNEGVSISPATLRSLGERGIELGLDIYAPDTEA
jgi:ribosomal protein L19